MVDANFNLFFNKKKGTVTVMDPETGQTVREATLLTLREMSDHEIIKLAIFIAELFRSKVVKISEGNGGKIFHFTEQD